MCEILHPCYFYYVSYLEFGNGVNILSTFPSARFLGKWWKINSSLMFNNTFHAVIFHHYKFCCIKFECNLFFLLLGIWNNFDSFYIFLYRMNKNIILKWLNRDVSLLIWLIKGFKRVCNLRNICRFLDKSRYEFWITMQGGAAVSQWRVCSFLCVI